MEPGRDPIAIIGHAGIFPLAQDVEALWALLVSGQHAIRRIPAGRWNLDGLRAYAGGDYPDHILQGGWLDDPMRFDPALFRMSPREARSLDPKQRLALLVARRALSHASIFPGRRPDLVFGSWVATRQSDFLQRAYHRGEVGSPHADRYLLTGNEAGFTGGRIHATLGLTGPGVHTDTQCSASLVALHQATQALRAHHCDVALVVGTQVLDRPEVSLAMHRFGLLSPDARCAAFDASAHGYVRGEAVGCLVLRRLHDAQEEGDQILTVVRGTAVNSNGRSDNLMATDAGAQRRLIRAALADAQVEPSAIRYVQTHGTGTPVGDPVEIRALLDTLTPTAPLHLTSVKTQVGHAELAAGIVSLVATVETLRRGVIPPHLHLRQRHPSIPDDAPIRIPDAPTPFPETSGPRLALVNAFGISGTNASAVLAQAPDPAPRDPGSAGPLWLAAPTRARLAQLTERWAEAAEAGHLSDATLARATQATDDHAVRWALTDPPSPDALAEVLRQAASGDPASGLHGEVGPPPAVLLAFTGQGSQKPGMGLSLDASSPLFSRALHVVDEALRPHLGRPIREVLAGDVDLSHTRWTQPALFALEWALAETWHHLGVVPHSLIGHSIGEIVAATRAGVLSLPDAATLVDARARGMAALPEGGGMAAIFLDASEVLDRIETFDEIELAADNGPRGAVVSGSVAALDRWLAILEADQVPFRRLQVSHAFHSERMAPMLDDFGEVLSGLTLRPARIPVYSNVTGQAETSRLADPSYWIDHIRQPVRFAPALRRAVDDGATLLLEVGPDATLCGMARRVLKPHPVPLVASLPPSKTPTSLTEPASRLWVAGVSLSTAALRMAPAPHAPVLSCPEALEHLEIEDPGPPEGRAPTPDQGPRLWRVRYDPIPPATTEPPAGTWIVVGGAGAERAAQALREAGHDVVSPSPGQPLADLLRLHAPIAAVVCAGCLDPALPQPADDGFDLAIRDHAFGLIAAFQAVDAHAPQIPLILWTRAALPAHRADHPHPVSAAVVGAARTLAAEHPELRLFQHDLGSADPLPSPDRWTPADEDALVWRGGEALAPRLLADAPAPPSNPRVRGTWVLTGGTGGLGRATADALLDWGAHRVVVVSRRPPQGDAADWLAAHRAAGHPVQHHAVDLADTRAVHDLLSQLHASHPVRGIIHAAGVLADAPIRRLSAERFAEVFPAKVAGLHALDAASRALQLPLDALIVYSSVTATLGAPGQANYGAANAAMEALIAQRHLDGLPGIALGWGPWAEVGMAAGLADLMAERGMGSLRSPDALGLLAAAIDRRDPLVLPLDLRWQALQTSAPARAQRPLFRAVVVARRAEAPTPAAAATAPVPPAASAGAGLSDPDALLATILQIATELLGFQPGELDPDRPLAWQGLDSVLAVDLQAAIQRQLGPSLPLDAVASGPRPRELATLAARAGARPPSPPAPPPPAASPPSDAPSTLDALAQEVERLLGHDPGGLDRERPLAWQGFDSVLAVDLQQRITARWGVTLPIDLLATGPRLTELAARLPDAPAAPVPSPAEPPPTADRLQDLPTQPPELADASPDAPPPPAVLWALLALLGALIGWVLLG